MPKVKYLGGATGAIQVDDIELLENGDEAEVTAEQLKRLQTIEGAQLEVDGKSAAPPTTAATPSAPVQPPTASTSTAGAGGST